MAETIQQAFHNLSLVLADITPEIKPSHEDSLLTSFTTSFLAILVCEIGDKTFFLGMIMAMKYNKLVVFTGAFLALAVMTVLSAIGGKVVFSFLPKIYTDIIVTLLFFYFGFKLIYEAYTADEEEGENEELKEVTVWWEFRSNNKFRKWKKNWSAGLNRNRELSWTTKWDRARKRKLW